MIVLTIFCLKKKDVSNLKIHQKLKKSKYWVKFWQLMLVSLWVKGWKGLLPKMCWWNSFFMVQELWCYTLTPLQDKKLFLAVLTHAGHLLPSFNLNYLLFFVLVLVAESCKFSIFSSHSSWSVIEAVPMI